MRHLAMWLLLMLALSMTPGVAQAQSIGTADGSAVTGLHFATPIVSPDYRLTAQAGYGDGHTPRSPATLVRLFAVRGGPGTPSHSHAAVYTLGGVEIIAEAMRERVLIATGGIGRAARVLDRVAAAGIAAGWPVSGRDTLSLAAAADIDKRTAPAILADHKSIDGSAIVADCTWVHGAHLQMSLAWRADRGSSATGLDRVVELAQGAALREQGLRLTLRYLLAGADASRGTTIGIAARDARIAAGDLATLGSVNRQDIQTGLFVSAAL
jgi:hypothetical protein